MVHSEHDNAFKELNSQVGALLQCEIDTLRKSQRRVPPCCTPTTETRLCLLLCRGSLFLCFCLCLWSSLVLIIAYPQTSSKQGARCPVHCSELRTAHSGHLRVLLMHPPTAAARPACGRQCCNISSVLRFPCSFVESATRLTGEERLHAAWQVGSTRLWRDL